MIGKIIEFSVKNRFLVILFTAAVCLWGLYCLFRTPVDAIPDLSENQVIVWADWPGRSPKEIEDQVTYPLSVNLQGLAGIKSVRATSEFGFSMINLIFDEGIDFYFARQRVLERLSTAGGFLPAGVVPYMAPDATALGQIFWYTVEGEGKSLEELRSIQDWYVRYQLNSVAGVAQVASAGGFVREYQIDIDPLKLRAYDLSLGQVFRAVMSSNSSVGGKVIHKGGAEYLVRGFGWVRGIEDLRDVVVAARNDVPITVEQLGAVQIGPAFRRSILEKDGREVTGGVVMMRFGENPLTVTQRIVEKIGELEAGLPAGVRIVPFYDRTGLIHASIDTLKHTLIEEISIASLVVFLVLWHARSALVICSTLPLAVLISFIFMYYLRIPSNIMSLSGIAISIGVLVDAGIVMTENAYHRLQERFGRQPVTGDTRPLVIEACKVVGGPLFFSILIMLLSFAPIFVLGGIEGKMFNPLAYTKSFALAGVALLAITLVPALIPAFIRGRLRSQEEVWLVRSFANIYRPMLEFFLKHPDGIVIITGIFLLAGLPVFPKKIPWIFFTAGVPFVIGLSAMLVARRKLTCLALLFAVALASFQMIHPLGEEFMPPLNELSIMDMPITTPNVNITQAGDDLKYRDGILRQFPEVHQAVGKLGRADTPTDPAPIDMVETVVSLRPQEEWPKRKIRLSDAEAESLQAAQALARRGFLKDLPEKDLEDLANLAVHEAVAGFDRMMRRLIGERRAEFDLESARDLIRLLEAGALRVLKAKRLLKGEPSDQARADFEEKTVREYSRRFAEWILLEDAGRLEQEVLRFLAKEGAVEWSGDLLAQTETWLSKFLDPVLTLAGKQKSSRLGILRARLEAWQKELRAEWVKRLNGELADHAPGAMVWLLLEECLAKAREKEQLLKEPSNEELQALRAELEKPFAGQIFLWQKSKGDLIKEMDSELQVPGWINIWTQPIINRVNMLATGVRTMIGVKVFGKDLETLQQVSNDIAAVLKGIRGAVDITPDQITGENYLEIAIDRKKAARYGASIEEIQNVIEVALGGKEITMTVEGRERFPVRVRYPRDWREDEEFVKTILVPSGSMGAAEPPPGGAMGAAIGAAVPPAEKSRDRAKERLRQVPLAMVASVTVAPGPSMIKSENGLLRSYVQLNVRDRDIVGFVEEAQQAVAAKVKLPPGTYLEWSGEFEHQMRAQKTLTIVFPAVILIIFLILYLTYRDLSDTLMMFLAVPGAVAGGALFQWLFGYHFSVAVWIGYIACFGLATETGIVMLVYLREAIDRRGGMAGIRSAEEIQEAVIEGAINRLRPKLLTEGTTILALIPMLWATGVGAEYMRPMAAPILGGILVADEVIDIFIPVLFYWDRRRRLLNREKVKGD